MGARISKNNTFSIPLLGPPGQNFPGFGFFSFVMDGSSASLSNFSFLRHLEVGQLFWTNARTFFTFLYRGDRYVHIPGLRQT
jgi:hypothetical protein